MTNWTISYTTFTLHFVLQSYPGESVFPDFSNPASIPWWTQQLSEFYSRLEFDGVWIVSYCSKFKYPLDVDKTKFLMDVTPDP